MIGREFLKPLRKVYIDIFMQLSKEIYVRIHASESVCCKNT